MMMMEFNSNSSSNSNQAVSKMETLVEEDEELAMASEAAKSSGVSSSISDFDEPGDKSSATSKGSKQYNLRTKSIANRVKVEEKRKAPVRREPKPKQRPAPLSKYRRKTANQRERTRMQEINDAFEELRSVVPQLPNDENDSDKLTKITTLRLAVNYIAALSEMLKESDAPCPSSSGLGGTTSGPHRPMTGQEKIQQAANAAACASNDQATISAMAAAAMMSNIISGQDVSGDLASLANFGLSEHDLVSDLDASFLIRQDISNRASSYTSSELASPNTTETESLESFTSGCGAWDFDEDGLDVPDTFDLILESEGEANI